jgi:hypothetical protein
MHIWHAVGGNAAAVMPLHFFIIPLLQFLNDWQDLIIFP